MPDNMTQGGISTTPLPTGSPVGPIPSFTPPSVSPVPAGPLPPLAEIPRAINALLQIATQLAGARGTQGQMLTQIILLAEQNEAKSAALGDDVSRLNNRQIADIARRVIQL